MKRIEGDLMGWWVYQCYGGIWLGFQLYIRQEGDYWLRGGGCCY